MVALQDMSAPGADTAVRASAGEAGLGPVAPVGVNHIVLNVRNMDESHQFWTEVVGLRLVGEFRQRPERPPTPRMRFYSGTGTAGVHHHDLALVENPNLPPLPIEWKMWDMPVAINHIAIMMPNRDAWLKQLAFLRKKGVKFHRRVNHGMTHSLYISDPNGYGVEVLYELPREVWGDNIQGALDFAEGLPTEGDEAFVDDTNYPKFGAAKAPAAE